MKDFYSTFIGRDLLYIANGLLSLGAYFIAFGKYINIQPDLIINLEPHVFITATLTLIIASYFIGIIASHAIWYFFSWTPFFNLSGYNYHEIENINDVYKFISNNDSLKLELMRTIFFKETGAKIGSGMLLMLVSLIVASSLSRGTEAYLLLNIYITSSLLAACIALNIHKVYQQCMIYESIIISIRESSNEDIEISKLYKLRSKTILNTFENINFLRAFVAKGR